MICSNKHLLNAYKKVASSVWCFFLFETGLANDLTTCFVNPGLRLQMPAL